MGRQDKPYRTLPRTNKSKRRDPRFWERCKALGLASNSSLSGPAPSSPMHYLLALRSLKYPMAWSSVLDLLHRTLQGARASLTHIGTSEDELTALVQTHHRLDAERHLANLRSLKYQEAWDAVLSNLRRAVDKGCLTLTEIHTSEDELTELVQKHHRLDAERHLASLRSLKYPEVWDSVLSNLRRAINEGRLTLAEIYTSEDELTTLVQTYHRLDAERHLGKLRRGIYRPNSSSGLALLRRAVREGNLTLADIRTTDDELAQWELKAS